MTAGSLHEGIIRSHEEGEHTVPNERQLSVSANAVLDDDMYDATPVSQAADGPELDSSTALPTEDS